MTDALARAIKELVEMVGEMCGMHGAMEGLRLEDFSGFVDKLTPLVDRVEEGLSAPGEGLEEAMLEYFKEADYLERTDMHDNYTDRARARDRQALALQRAKAQLSARRDAEGGASALEEKT